MNGDDVKRVLYYEKQFLRPRDFQDEQAYHIEMRRRHNIAHHTWGIVTGLEITQDAATEIWSVQPGMAVDGYGREIFVAAPVPLDIEAIRARLAGETSPTPLKIWLAQRLEKTDRPEPGYETCDQPNPFTRVRETFRLIYQDDPPGHEQTIVPQPFEKLVDDPGSTPWPVYLGVITWDPVAREITAVTTEDARDRQKRQYLGAVAAEILAPQPNLLIKSRNYLSPLPPDPANPEYNGVAAKVEGTLQIERLLTANQDVHVRGKVGIGTNSPGTALEVTGNILGDEIRGTKVIGASWSHTENIGFTENIIINSTALTEVAHYKREITTPSLANLIVTLHIPFTGNNTAGNRSRILLKFDDAAISDATKHDQGSWELHEITLTGLVQSVTAGTHRIQVFAAVSAGELHIPHYNPDRIEATLSPAIFANLYLLGFY